MNKSTIKLTSIKRTRRAVFGRSAFCGGTKVRVKIPVMR